jgi:hypothetical protein
MLCCYSCRYLKAAAGEGKTVYTEGFSHYYKLATPAKVGTVTGPNYWHC